MTDFAPSFPAVPVRILALLVFAAGLATAQPWVLLLGIALLGGLAIVVRVRHSAVSSLRIVNLLRRVRWLLLAILILYGWFLPGTPVLPELGSLSPTQEGLWQGLLRVAALCGIVAAVYLLLTTTARGELVAGLLWFGRPLRRAGIDDRRFAVRLVLALEAVPQVQDLARAALADAAGGSRVQRLGNAAAKLLQTTLARAEHAPGEIAAPDPQPVPAWQWGMPLGLAVLLWAATHL